MKKTSILLLVFLFILASVTNAQFIGNINGKLKTKKNDTKKESVKVSKGQWYVHLGKLYDRYAKTDEVKHNIFGPKAVKDMLNMGSKGRLNGSMLVSKSKDPTSFKPAMQYPELSDVIMKTNKIPSIPTFYFSNKPIDPKNPGANAKDSFANNERIYGLVKYDRPLKDFLGADVSSLPDKPYLLFQYTVTPLQVQKSSTPTSNPMFIKKEDLENDYLAFDVIPDPAKASREFRLYSLLGYLATMTRPSNNEFKEQPPVKTIRIDILGWNKKISHQINLDLNSYNFDKLESDKKLAKENVAKK